MVRICEPARYAAISSTKAPEMRVSVSWLRNTSLPTVVVMRPSSTKISVNPSTNMPVLIAMRFR